MCRWGGGMESMSLSEPMSVPEIAVNWYALKVFYNKVFEIEKILQTEGVETYIPTEQVTIEVKGMKKHVRKVILPSLMFFRSTEEFAIGLQQKLMGRVMVYTNLEKRPNRRPAPISDEEMHNFRLVVSAGDEGLEFFADDYMQYKDGQKVRVTGGVFEGAEGVIKRIKHNRRLTVTLKGVCMVATSFIDPKWLETVE